MSESKDIASVEEVVRELVDARNALYAHERWGHVVERVDRAIALLSALEKDAGLRDELSWNRLTLMKALAFIHYEASKTDAGRNAREWLDSNMPAIDLARGAT